MLQAVSKCSCDVIWRYLATQVYSAVNNNQELMGGSGEAGLRAGYQSGEELLGSGDEEETLPEVQDFWSDDDGDYEEGGRKSKKSQRKK